MIIPHAVRLITVSIEIKLKYYEESVPVYILLLCKINLNTLNILHYFKITNQID